MKPVAILDLQELFERFGQLTYGEGVTQLEHALQCGALAQRDGASTELVVSAFVHDVGHFLHQDADAALQAGVDDRHEVLGAVWLAERFPLAVCEPVRLHVEAKRWLCLRDPEYYGRLSPASKKSLALQGGLMTEDEAMAFHAQPFARDAIGLRRWDDAGKVAGLAVPPLAHFLSLAAPLAKVQM